MPLQPRVFDLLVYLVRNRARVVSKDELLDALWPGVTVTDNSLQRAVSTLARRAARRRHGRRDPQFPAQRLSLLPRSGRRRRQMPSAQKPQVDTPYDLEAARQATAEQRWSDAATLYASGRCSEPLAGEDLDRWALALQCLGKPSDAIPCWFARSRRTRRRRR